MQTAVHSRAAIISGAGAETPGETTGTRGGDGDPDDVREAWVPGPAASGGSPCANTESTASPTASSSVWTWARDGSFAGSPNLRANQWRSQYRIPARFHPVAQAHPALVGAYRDAKEVRLRKEIVHGQRTQRRGEHGTVHETTDVRSEANGAPYDDASGTPASSAPAELWG
jgi:hypothetical protein